MIPIENIYFLLCYAWDRFDEGGMAQIEKSDFTDAADLFATVLISGVGRLLRQGLDRGYLEHEEVLSTIRGRIDVSYTVRHGLHRKGRVLCRFDELEYNVLQNRIVKSTLKRLIKVEGLDSSLREKLVGLTRRMSEIEEIPLNQKIFKRVKIHRNNRFYRFLLNICELVVSYTSPDERTGAYRFREFLQDEKRMPMIFQQFVFNFMRREQRDYRVSVDRLKWPARAFSQDREGDLDFLPGMETDISLRSNERTVIVDTKYYAQALTSRFEGSIKAHSGNLYQMHAYLSSLEDRKFPDNTAEGVLLYPTNGSDVDLAWIIKGHVLRVRTVNLAQNWRDIRNDLLGILH